MDKPTISDRLLAARKAMLELINDSGLQSVSEDYCSSVDVTIYDAWTALNQLEKYLGETQLAIETEAK